MRKTITVEVGDRFGDSEVLQFLGVVDGHSRALVLHLPTNKQHVVSVSALRSGKFSGWGKAGSNHVKRLRYGVSYKPGKLAKRTSQKTFGELRKRLKTSGLVVSSRYADDEVAKYPNSSSHKIEYTCFCGATSQTRFDALWYGGTKSCGCDKSKSQGDLFQFVQALTPDAVSNDRLTIAPYELDLYIPSKKVAIEFCGLYWHGEKLLSKKVLERGGSLAQAKAAHLDKLTLCRKAGIRLITVFSDEWLTKQDIVKGRLGVILGSAEKGPGARKLKIEEVSASTARPFLSRHHIQGACRSRLYLGAFYQEALVAVMSFSRPNASRASVDKYDWELVRFATDGKLYSGLASKMLERFIRANNPRNLVSYSDNRWSEGHLYEVLGFALLKENGPSYWYFKDHGWGERTHRYGFRKSVALKKFGGDPEKDTEWSIMSRSGYDRIWDCGSKTWLWARN